MFHPGHDHRLGPSYEGLDDYSTQFARMVEQLKKGLQKMSILRAKVRVSEVVHVKDGDGATSQERVSLIAVYGKEGTENAKWSKWTPSASFTLTINNPDAFGKLSSGHEFYVDFTPVA